MESFKRCNGGKLPDRKNIFTALQNMERQAVIVKN